MTRVNKGSQFYLPTIRCSSATGTKASCLAILAHIFHSHTHYAALQSFDWMGKRIKHLQKLTGTQTEQQQQPPFFRPLYRSTCSVHWRILLVQSFTARMPLLTTTSAFGLGRRCWRSPQQLATLYPYPGSNQHHTLFQAST